MSQSALDNKKCGFTRKPCMTHDCAHYMQIQGKNPQTGAPMDRWDCSVNAAVFMAMDNARATISLDGEVSKFREEQSKVGDMFKHFVEVVLAAVSGKPPATQDAVEEGKEKQIGTAS